MIEYKVITMGNPLEVWARGFYGDDGRQKAEGLIAQGYWHRLMYPADRHKTLVAVPVAESFIAKQRGAT